MDDSYARFSHIRFYTERFPPNHSITVRVDADGADYPIYGSYRRELDTSQPETKGYWLFELDQSRYEGGPEDSVLVSFVLDGHHVMNQAPFAVRLSGEHVFDDDSITFSDPPERFIHGHDNLQVFETPVQQHQFMPNHSEHIVYDVIVIGSGMSGGILSDELSERGARVLLLEAGSVLFPTHIYNLPGDWEPLKERYFVYPHTLAPKSTFHSA